MGLGVKQIGNLGEAQAAVLLVDGTGGGICCTTRGGQTRTYTAEHCWGDVASTEALCVSRMSAYIRVPPRTSEHACTNKLIMRSRVRRTTTREAPVAMVFNFLPVTARSQAPRVAR